MERRKLSFTPIEECEVVPEKQKRTADLLIFGQGPVIDVDTRNKPEAVIGSEAGPHLWLGTIAEAAKLLYHHQLSDTRNVVILGGKTGEDTYPSEAEVTIDAMIKGENAIPAENTRGEHSSTNTLENLVNYCNEVLDNPDVPKGERTDILVAPYHMNRTKLLMHLFDIPYRNVFSSDAVLLQAAQERGDEHAVTEITRRRDINAAARAPLSTTEQAYDEKARANGILVGYYDGQKGAEQKTIERRIQEEDLWAGALLEISDYSLPYFARIQDDDRLMRIMKNFDTKFFPAEGDKPSALMERGIDVEHDTPEAIRGKLSTITRNLHDEAKREEIIKEYTANGWPSAIEQKFTTILQKESSR